MNSSKKIVYFSFYFNLKIVRFFCRTLYKSILQKYYIVVLWVLTPYGLLDSYKYTALWHFYFEAGGSMFIWYLGNYLPDLSV